MTKEIIEKKKLLKQSWVVVKDPKAKIADRKAAAQNIVDLNNDLVEMDKTFNSSDFKQTRYACLLKGELPEWEKTNSEKPEKKIINWPTVATKFGKKEEEELEKWTAVAYRATKKQYPTMNEELDKFGQIVNAKITHLISLTK